MIISYYNKILHKPDIETVVLGLILDMVYRSMEIPHVCGDMLCDHLKQGQIFAILEPIHVHIKFL